MKAAAAPLSALAVVCLAWAVPSMAAPTRPAAAQDGVIAVKSSFDASPSVALSPAAPVAQFDARPLPGLFEQESPVVLVGMALLLGVARVGKALLDRRLRLARQTVAPSRTGTIKRASTRPLSSAILLGDKLL